MQVCCSFNTWDVAEILFVYMYVYRDEIILMQHDVSRERSMTFLDETACDLF